MDIEALATVAVDCGFKLHERLGPGLLESVYKPCMIEEIRLKGMFVASEIHIPVSYKGKDLGGILKLDLLVENLVIVELKAVDILHPVYKAQLLSYLKLTGMPKGLLINFNVYLLKEGIFRLVNNL